MKVSYSAGMGTLSGRYREIVYCHSRKYGYTYARQRVYPTLTEVNAAIGSKSANICRLLGRNYRRISSIFPIACWLIYG